MYYKVRLLATKTPSGRTLKIHKSLLLHYRSRNVYCTYIASSYMCNLAPPPGKPSSKWVPSTHWQFWAPCPPLYVADALNVFLFIFSSRSVEYLFNVLLQPPHLHQVQVSCHLMCVLTLSLSWVCSLCNSIFKEVSIRSTQSHVWRWILHRGLGTT